MTADDVRCLPVVPVTLLLDSSGPAVLVRWVAAGRGRGGRWKGPAERVHVASAGSVLTWCGREVPPGAERVLGVRVDEAVCPTCLVRLAGPHLNAKEMAAWLRTALAAT